MRTVLTPNYVLLTEKPGRRYGIQRLVHRQTGDAFGPSDVHEFYPNSYMTASAFVCRVCRYGEKLTAKRRAAAKMFLAQWTDGPQLK